MNTTQTSTSTDYFYVQDMARLMEAVQTDSIISRTVYSDGLAKVVLFGFDTGQALSEHKASQPATIQILQGEATITLGGDTKEAAPGTWIHMPANLSHSVVAKTPLIMLLTLYRGSESEG